MNINPSIPTQTPSLVTNNFNQVEEIDLSSTDKKIYTCSNNCPGPSCMQGQGFFEINRISPDSVSIKYGTIVVHNPYTPIDLELESISDSPDFYRMTKLKDGTEIETSIKNKELIQTRLNYLKEKLVAGCARTKESLEEYRMRSDFGNNKDPINAIPGPDTPNKIFEIGSNENYDLGSALAVGLTAVVTAALIGWGAWKYYKNKHANENL